MLGPSAHIDTFTRDNLPPREQLPDFLLAGFDYPERLNIGVELTDRMVQKGFGDNTALIGNGRRRTYKELTDWTNRLARDLTAGLLDIGFFGEIEMGAGPAIEIGDERFVARFEERPVEKTSVRHQSPSKTGRSLATKAR